MAPVYYFSSASSFDISSNSYYPPQNPNYAAQYGTSYWGAVTSIEDRNGNVIYVGWPGVTDDAGRQLVTAGGSGSTTTLSILGQANPYTESWTSSVPINFNMTSTPFGTGACSGIAPPQADGITISGLQTLTLPNGQKYQFQYDPVYGLLSRITYPDGGYVSYTWGLNTQSEVIQLPPSPSGTSNGAICFATYDVPAIVQRVVSYDGVTQAEKQIFSYYTNWPGANSYGWTTKTTTVTTTDLLRNISSDTVYTYTPTQFALAPNVPSTLLVQIPQEQSTVYKDFNGAMLKTVVKGWGDPFLLSCELEVLDNGLIAGTWYGYGLGGVITDKKEYDYGLITSSSACSNSASAPANPTRETVTAYQTFNPTAIFPNYASIFDRPSSVKVYSGGSTGTPMAETDYTYDAYGTGGIAALTATSHDDANFPRTNQNRGNLTKKTVRCFQTGCSDAITTYTYDQTGHVTSVTDPCGNATCSDMTGTNHTTQYDYTDSYSNHSAASTYAPCLAQFLHALLANECTRTKPPNKVTRQDIFRWRPAFAILR